MGNANISFHLNPLFMKFIKHLFLFMMGMSFIGVRTDRNYYVSLKLGSIW